MADPLVTPALAEALARADAAYLGLVPKQRLLRRSGLYRPGLDSSNIAIWSLLGWVHASATRSA